MEKLPPTWKTTRGRPRRTTSKSRPNKSRNQREFRNPPRNKSKAMDELIDRVTCGRIFKQIVVYAHGRKDSNGYANVYNRSLSVFEDAEDCYMQYIDLIDSKRPIDPAEPVIEANDLGGTPRTDNPWVENEAVNEESPTRAIIHVPAVEYIHKAGKFPLVAKYPELFTFVDKDNEVGTGISLTEAVVWQLNAVLQGEQKKSGYVSQITSLEVKCVRKEEGIADINSQLEGLLEGFEASSALVEAVLQDQQELEGLSQLRAEVILEIQALEKAIGEVDGANLPEGGLLQSFEDEFGPQLIDLQKSIPTGVEARAKPAPTPSEATKYELQDAREAAADAITQMIIQKQDAQEKFDTLQDRYQVEYDAYRARIENGSIKMSKTEFDGTMLLESRKITADFIQAEKELEQARNHARNLGLILDEFDQESCFVDFPEDGYRESLEQQWIDYVDREEIKRWMDREDDPPEKTDCDEWESKTVDISDNVSAIADTFKSRKRAHRRLEGDMRSDGRGNGYERRVNSE